MPSNDMKTPAQDRRHAFTILARLQSATLASHTWSTVSMCRYTPGLPLRLELTSFPSTRISNTSSPRVELAYYAAGDRIENGPGET